MRWERNLSAGKGERVCQKSWWAPYNPSFDVIRGFKAL